MFFFFTIIVETILTHTPSCTNVSNLWTKMMKLKTQNTVHIIFFFLKLLYIPYYNFKCKKSKMQHSSQKAVIALVQLEGVAILLIIWTLSRLYQSLYTHTHTTELCPNKGFPFVTKPQATFDCLILSCEQTWVHLFLFRDVVLH